MCLYTVEDFFRGPAGQRGRPGNAGKKGPKGKLSGNKVALSF